ncbi:MAG: DNA polymerase III subunit beta [Armatimonadota bacterium]
MRAICNRRVLAEAVGTALKAVPTRTALPIQSHFLLTAPAYPGGGGLRIAGADYELQIEVVADAQVVEEGQCTAVARILADLVRALPDGDVELASRPDGHVDIKTTTSEYTLFGLPPEEFPPLADLASEQTFTIQAGLLNDLIRQTVFACSTDQSRPQLVGANLVVEGANIKMAGTDGNRLSVRRGQLAQPVAADISCIVPARALHEVQSVVDKLPNDQDVEVGITQNQIAFRIASAPEQTGCGGINVISRLIDGQFPNFERVIPQQWTRRITVQTAEMQSALRRCKAMAGDTRRVVFRTEGDVLVLTTESATFGRGREQVEVVREGEDIEIAFDVNYLEQFLAVAGTEGTVIEMTGSLAPGVMRPMDGADLTYVLMPMQLV